MSIETEEYVRTESPMTIAELKKVIQDFPDDMPVALDYDSLIDNPWIGVRWLVLKEGTDEWRDPEYMDVPPKHGDVKKVLVFR